ncbi:MAG TPA: Gfo/Idh/MocA family oxidoreductase [Micropepsaceae bacterium]|nr:Gfo/Idh/MocA family oxidoreductase [Micropepsaceae bacterium]
MTIHQLASQRVLRAAVIGAGVFGRHHAAKYLRVPGLRLEAVADLSAEARLYIETHFDVPAVADWRDLLGKVDVVSVCSPASTHAEIVRAFLNAGAHVLVEKPIATDLEEAEELIELAAARGLVLTVGHQERFVFAKSGLLDYEDAPLSVECVREGPWTGRGTDVSVVLDLMIHDLDLVHRLVPGTLAGVRAEGRSVCGELTDQVAANLVFDNGCEVELIANRAADARRRSMRVVYADGEIEIDFLTRKVTNTSPRKLQKLDLGDPLWESVAAFVTAARAGASSLVRPEEACRALETALLIEDALVPTSDILAAEDAPLRRTA